MDLPKGQKMMERNFDFGPGFGLMAQFAQKDPKLENWTSPTVFELGSSSPRVILTYLRQKNLRYETDIPTNTLYFIYAYASYTLRFYHYNLMNSWSEFFIRGPVLELWP